MSNGNRHEFSDLEDAYTQRMKEQEAAKNVIIKGVGADAEIVTNAQGGKQSKSPMAMHLIDPIFLNDWFNDPTDPDKDDVIYHITAYMRCGEKDDLINAIFEAHCLKEDSLGGEDGALVDIATVLQYGASKYKANNWRLIPQEEHINHALIHYLAYKMGDTQDDHLEHCMCRLMMAYATNKSEGFEFDRYVA